MLFRPDGSVAAGRHSNQSAESPGEIGGIVKAGHVADFRNRILRIFQQRHGMLHSDIQQVFHKGFLRHQLEQTAEIGFGQPGIPAYRFQRQ